MKLKSWKEIKESFANESPKEMGFSKWILIIIGFCLGWAGIRNIPAGVHMFYLIPSKNKICRKMLC